MNAESFAKFTQMKSMSRRASTVTARVGSCTMAWICPPLGSTDVSHKQDTVVRFAGLRVVVT